MPNCEARTQVDATAKLLIADSEIVRGHACQRETLHHVALGKVVIKVHGLLRIIAKSVAAIDIRQITANSEVPINLSQTGIGKGIVRVLADGFLKLALRSQQIVPRPSMNIRPAHHVVLKGW